MNERETEGWKEAAIAWSVCASIHETWAKGKDALYKTRHADFVRHADDARARALATPPSAPTAVEPDNVTRLPDGSAFAIASFPLPDSHWLYAPREYAEGADVPKELPRPILNHTEHREAVVAAIRYAVRGATMCGKEPDFDPDALVQNAVYALCGPFGGRATLAEKIALATATAQAAEPDFDDCAESPTGKHSASWFSNDNCEYCNTGEVSAPLYYAPSEMQLTPQEQEHVATVQCVRGVTIGYLEKMLPVGTKLYTAQPARQPLTDEPPAVGSITELG